MRNRQETSQKFSIKKFKFGAASVLIGVVFASFTGTAQADTETVSSGETLNVQSEASQSVEASTQALDSSQSDSAVTSSEVESTTTSEAVEKESTIDTSVSPTIVSNPASENTTPTMTTVEETASASQGNYAVTNKVVYLDAGHGGVDPGAVYSGTKEADLTLSIYQLVKNQLEDAGYAVESSRTSAASVGLLERSADANDTNSDIFVSIHVNASATSSTAGVETYWYEPDSNYPSQLNSRYHVDTERLKRSAYLAESIQAATVSKTGANDRGVQRNTFAVLRETTAPAVLVEVGYLSNPVERANLVTENYQQQVASAIVGGILDYYQKYNQSGQAATSSQNTSVKLSSTSTSKSTSSNLSSSGTYEFKTRTGVKNEAKLSSEDLAYYEVGQTVNYDKVVSSEGYNWLSYVSYSGNRRYVPVEKVSSSSTTPSAATTPSSSTTPVKTESTKVETSQSVASNLSSSGTYEFKTRTGVKNEAKLSSEDLAYYEVGQTVNYDKVVSSEGYNWLSYVSYSGNRRYVPVEKITSTSSSNTTTPVKAETSKVETAKSTSSSLSSSGIYEFTTRTGVKNEAKLSSEDLAYYEVGQKVNYDKVVLSDGYNWLSYVSYSGNRRYVPVEKITSTSSSNTTTPVKAETSKVETTKSTSSSLSSSGTYEFTTRTGVKNEAKLSSDNLAYYEVGQTVNYDKVVSSEGYNWLSYVSYSGNRRYVPVEKTDQISTPVVEKAAVDTTSSSENALPKMESVSEKKETVKTENGYTTRISYQGTGVYKVNIDNVDANKGTVKMAVWSEENSQDDIRWYDLKMTNGVAEGKFDASNHVGTGRYQIHLYQNKADTMTFLSAVSQEVKRTNFDAPYYSQRDARWASKRYGLFNMDATGCVPTVLSMVFSGLIGEDIKPTTVADYLYNETISFNKLEQGTNATGIISAAEKWNMDATPLKTQADIEEALKEGHYVLAAVQGSPFVRVYGSLSHELVLAGYDNGKTYVRDPYTPSLNGWHSLSNIFTQQSKFASDIVGIGKPFVKITDRL
ncbi:SH3 domain-containing protein [Streptococcus sp. sy004]|uniref:SH3 domain-containing protein n=1 Tax=Streptococcus sp. sy004 TaxID=2600149 RepID=UPI0011B5F1D8|nr:SH3 domain-containing protein [Streptococcus sp. sy004]TWT10453.1 YSIRK-type signal peptide-containing protein [Streptococcus sp. sy004]